MSFKKSFVIVVAIFSLISCNVLKELNSTSINGGDNIKSPNSTTSVQSTFKTRSDPGKVKSWAYQKLLIKAIESNNIAGVKKYIEMGANPNWGESEHEPESAMYIAALNGCKECVAAMAPTADFNFSWKLSWYLPVVGASKHSKEMLVYMVENFDVDVNATAYGRTGQENALASLVSKSKPGCISYLLSKGVNPNYGSPSPWYDYVFSENIKNGKVDEVKAFLTAGADVNIASSRTTVLGQAIDMKRQEIAKLLVEAGANPNYCNDEMERGRPPIYYAIKRNDYKMVKLLVDNKANVNCNSFNECRCSGSPLDQASDDRRIDSRVIDILIENGAR